MAFAVPSGAPRPRSGERLLEVSSCNHLGKRRRLWQCPPCSPQGFARLGSGASVSEELGKRGSRAQREEIRAALAGRREGHAEAVLCGADRSRGEQQASFETPHLRKEADVETLGRDPQCLVGEPEPFFDPPRRGESSSSSSFFSFPSLNSGRARSSTAAHFDSRFDAWVAALGKAERYWG